NTMAEQNVPAQPPTRTDEQIVPRSQWLTIGKSNLLFNAQKIQKNPIFQISVDILSNTNFFQAFTASANVPAIYLQQFWKTMSYNEKTGVYSCQVDEQWFDLSADLLRKALAITPVNPTHPFELPPSGDTVIDFVNELGYPEPVEIERLLAVTNPDTQFYKCCGESSLKLMLIMQKSDMKRVYSRDPGDIFLTSKQGHKANWGGDWEAQQKSIPQEEGNDPDLELAKKLSLETHQEKGEGEGDDAELERAIKLSLDPAFLPQGRAPVGGVTIRDPVSEATPKLHEVVGKGKAVVTEEQVAHSLIDLSKKKRTTDQFILVRRDQTPPVRLKLGPSSQPDDDTSEKVIHESSSTSDSERTESETEAAAPKGDKDQGEVDSSTVTSGVSIPVSDPVKAHEALAGPDLAMKKYQSWDLTLENYMWSLAGTNPEHFSWMYGFLALSALPEEVSFFLAVIIGHSSTNSTRKANNDHHFSPEITPFIAFQLKWQIGEEMSEDPKLDVALLKSEEIIRAKKEQMMEKLVSTSPSADEDAMDKEVADKLDQTCGRATSDGDLILPLLGQLNLLRKMMPKVQRNQGSLRHLLPNNIQLSPQLDGRSLTQERLESERPATPEPEWTIPPNDFPEPEHNWANAYAITKEDACKADLEGPAFNLVKAFHKNSVFLQYQMDECHKLLTNKVDLSNPEGHQILRNIYEPLPLGGPPGQVTIQPQFFFNKDLDYLLTGDKERKIALSISKLKVAHYLDFGLEELVPSLWVESEREYDISAVYGITHWWFRRKEFYINKHSESSDREAVRSQMRILSVISVKVFEKYGYNYLREIILRRADYQEYKISEKDFKNLHPNDFEDLFLLNIQEKLNHLPKTDKTSLHTAVNMWIRNLVIGNHVGDLQLGIESYQTKSTLNILIGMQPTITSKKTIRSSLSQEQFVILPEHLSETTVFHNEDGNPARANIKQALGSFKDGVEDGDTQFSNVQIIRNILLLKATSKIYKEFGYQKTGGRLPARHRELPDSTDYKILDSSRSMQIDEALDYRVKEFKVNKVNPGLNTRFWTKNDVIKSKQFMFAIQKRLKLRRIFRNLESFVGGRIREGDYRLLQRTE
ncbi:hypothetical protein Tco_0541060, partial [Tanacetum coccineum]